HQLWPVDLSHHSRLPCRKRRGRVLLRERNRLPWKVERFVVLYHRHSHRVSLASAVLEFLVFSRVSTLYWPRGWHQGGGCC
ncbi:hypothetical protein FOZ63_025130, partial [Perkinsus olseni]